MGASCAKCSRDIGIVEIEDMETKFAAMKAIHATSFGRTTDADETVSTGDAQESPHCIRKFNGNHWPT